jgi:hypothetical protein
MINIIRIKLKSEKCKMRVTTSCKSIKDKLMEIKAKNDLWYNEQLNNIEEMKVKIKNSMNELNDSIRKERSENRVSSDECLNEINNTLKPIWSEIVILEKIVVENDARIEQEQKKIIEMNRTIGYKLIEMM